MFNLGWGELVVIGIVALIAIGPKELPTVLRTLGQWMGKVRRMANEFQGQFQEAMREAEFADLKKHADDISARSATSPISIRWPTRRRTSSAPSKKRRRPIRRRRAAPAVDAASPRAGRRAGAGAAAAGDRRAAAGAAGAAHRERFRARRAAAAPTAEKQAGGGA